ncbi:MAG: hypothetical protein HC769_06875 [Cyanobacteria bacterium CRU_2_1]|nr:hypothetical protein [Cyanobacteria bacterium RU_5_0]NJR58598.1 hypothetical protein [Cyanobacteria bacterium CRU_2_1]
MLQNRDYTIIFAKTATDGIIRPPGFAERWALAQASVLRLIQKCEEFDPDGITVYLACRSPEEGCLFEKYERVTSTNLIQVIESSYPPEQANLQEVLQAALDDYFARKTAGKTKANGEIILVLIDGEPSDRMAVAKLIKAATHKMDTDEELGIGFVQIGEDSLARGFLEALDNNLKQTGARFDIVTTKLLDTIEPDSLAEFLLSILYD